MLSYETKIRLAEVLLAFAEHEQQVEVVRQILCEQDAFEPYAAFRRIDRAHKGYLTHDDLLDFLKDNSVQHPVIYCDALIKKYAKKTPSKLNYIEFLNIVLTQDNSQLRAETAQRPNYEVRDGEFLPVDVEYSLAKVFDRELILLAQADDLKFGLINRFDFTPLDAFTAIDQARTDRIDYENLSRFFREVSIFPHEEDIVGCLRRLDRDGDGVLSREEFCEGLALVDERLFKMAKLTPNIHHEKSPMRAASPTRKLSFTPSNAQTPHRSPNRRREDTEESMVPKQSPIKIPDFSIMKKATTPVKKTSQSNLRRETSPLSRNSPSSRRSPMSRNSPSRNSLRSKSPILDENQAINKRLKELNNKLKSSVSFSQDPRIRTDLSPIRADVSPIRADLSPVRSGAKNGTTPKKRGVNDSRKKSGIHELSWNDLDSSIKMHGSPFTKSSVRTRADRSPATKNPRSNNQSPARKTPLNNSRRSSSKISIDESSPFEKDFFKPRNASIMEEARKSYPQVQFDDKDNQSLLHIMKQFISMEKELETAKQDLALRPDFNLFDFFRVFDTEGKGSLTSGEFQKGLKIFGVTARNAEMYLFMRRFDRDNDGKLK